MLNINKKITDYSKALKLDIIYLLLPLFLIGLVGCSDGSSGGSSDDSNDIPTVQNGATINATYSKGPVTGAAATLLDGDGNIVAGPVTTVNGSASFVDVTYDGPVYASFSGGNYTDEATGVVVTLETSFVIRSGVIDNAGTGSLDIVATPLTEIAFQRAQDAALSLDIDLSTVDFYIARVADEYGLDGINLTETPPTSLTDIAGTSDGDLYGAVLAAISQQILNAGAPPESAALENYITDNVDETDGEAFVAAVTGLASNPNTSAFVSESITNTVNNAAGAATVDTTLPVLTLLGDNPLIVEINTDITSALLLFSAIDDVNGDLQNRVILNVEVDTATVGEYSVLYRVADLSGNETSATRIVQVVDTNSADTTKPVITLIDANAQTVVVGNAYVESGATATDNVDGDISANIVVDNSSVNTGVINSYTVTYNVADAAGNNADTVTRAVNVVASGSDITAPTATITFPTAFSATDTDTVTIRGTAADDSDIAIVRVNGVEVHTEDDYAHWDATINLVAGENTLSVETTDSTQNTNLNAASVQIKSEPFFVSGTRNVLDSDNNRVLFVDDYRQAVLAVDLTTGIRSVFSDATTPNAINPIVFGADIVLDATNNQALVFDSSGILAINLDSGARTFVYEFNTYNSSPKLLSRKVMELDSARNRILLADATRIIQVNLATGERTILSDWGTPNALLAFGSIQDMVMDSANNRLLVLDAATSNNRVISVTLSEDATDGTRSIVSDRDSSTEGISTYPRINGIALDSSNQQILATVYDYPNEKVMTIDLADGVRRSIHEGNGLSKSSFESILLDNVGGRALLFDSYNRILTSMDLTAGPDYGETAVISSNSFPQANIARNPKTAIAIAIDVDNDRLFQFDTTEASLLAVDLTTGVTSVVSTDAAPSALTVDGGQVLFTKQTSVFSLDLDAGTISPVSTFEIPDDVNPFTAAGDIELDSENNRAYILDSGVSVFEVSLLDGARSILSDENTPDSTTSFGGLHMALDSDNDRLLVVDSVIDQVVAVDLSNGASTIFSNNSTPNAANPFWHISTIALDSNNNQALVAGTIGAPDYGTVVFSVNLSDGSRTVLSSNNTGNRLYNPTLIEVDSNNNRALILNDQKVMAIDLVNGKRVVVYE